MSSMKFVASLQKERAHGDAQEIKGARNRLSPMHAQDLRKIKQLDA